MNDAPIDLMAAAADMAAATPLDKFDVSQPSLYQDDTWRPWFARLRAEAPWDARTVLDRLLAADPAAYGYLVDLTPAGPGFAGAALVGASPELLVARSGDRVTCRPFAG